MDREFKNLRKVAEYLKSEGWKICQSSLYNHQKQGKIQPNKNGNYSLKAILKYARMHLVLEKTRQNIQFANLQQRKLAAEIARTTEEAKLRQIKRMIEEGKYIPKEEVYLELAGRGAVLDDRLNYWIQAEAFEWIDLVGGNPDKVAELIRDMIAGKDEMLNEFASTREFQVLFTEKEEE